MNRLRTSVLNEIRQLLYLHDLVVLPELGAFVAYKLPVKVDKKKSFFYPTRKHLSFNTLIIRNDGLLINSFAHSNKISYELAAKEVEKFRHELLYRIDEDGRFDMEGFGYFSKNADGFLQFQFNAHENFAIDSYGLATFYLQPTKIEKLPAKQKLQLDRKKIAIRTLILTPIVLGLTVFSFQTVHNPELSLSRIGVNPRIFWENTQSVKSEGNVNEDSSHPGFALSHNSELNMAYHITNSKLSDGCYFLNADNALPFLPLQENIAPTMPDEIPEDFTVENSSQASVCNDAIDASLENEQVQPSLVSVGQENNTELDKIKEFSEYRYYLVAASYAALNPATKFQSQLIDSGFDAEVLPTKSGRYRVTYRSFDKKGDALQALSNLRLSQNPDTWILREKN